MNIERPANEDYDFGPVVVRLRDATGIPISSGQLNILMDDPGHHIDFKVQATEGADALILERRGGKGNWLQLRLTYLFETDPVKFFSHIRTFYDCPLDDVGGTIENVVDEFIDMFENPEKRHDGFPKYK